MGQKVNPNGLRLKITKTWDSKWFAPISKMWDLVIEDKRIRDYLKSKLVESWVSKIEIARTSSRVILDIHTSKPWVVIWRQWAQIDELKTNLDRLFKKDFELNVREIKKPNLESAIIAEWVARAIEKRVPYRRAIKQAIARATEDWAQWVKIYIWWRLNWAEIARWEFYKEWNIPLHTLRTDISYSRERANTTYWVLGIKVWVYRWEVFDREIS